MSRTLKLMAVLAHPDDESLGLGGVLAKYRSEGVETSLVTATRGDAGLYLGKREGPDYPGREKLGAIREAELRAAAEVLGIGDVTVLGYPDGRLDEADPAEVIGRIVAEVRRVRPDVVVTFPPDGSYGHPDHVAVCQLTNAGLVAAADTAHRAPGAPHAVAKLYYMVDDPQGWAAYQAAFKRLSYRVDGVEREAVPWPEWAITTVIDTRAFWPTAWKAIVCHRSQMASYQRLDDLPKETHEALWGWHHFYRAFSTVNGGRRRETDLFEGLRGRA